jgi:hypothetical protein
MNVENFLDANVLLYASSNAASDIWPLLDLS